MMKQNYTAPVAMLTAFAAADILSTSDDDIDNDIFDE